MEDCSDSEKRFRNHAVDKLHNMSTQWDVEVSKKTQKTTNLCVAKPQVFGFEMHSFPSPTISDFFTPSLFPIDKYE